VLSGESFIEAEEKATACWRVIFIDEHIAHPLLSRDMTFRDHPQCEVVGDIIHPEGAIGVKEADRLILLGRDRTNKGGKRTTHLISKEIFWLEKWRNSFGK